ncbi:MAG: 3-oxoadipate enol-lactonase [Pseudomonadota bacterium]
MHALELGEIHIHFRDEGDRDGPAVVFGNSLGTDMRLWNLLVPLLPKGLRLVRFDKRGHGLSSCPPGPYSMGSLVTDTERLMDHLAIKNCVFVGLSIGGMIAQGLAKKRPDLLKAMVLSNTAAKIATAEIWQQRIDTVLSKGIPAMSDVVLERWFTAAYRATDDFTIWRNMLERTPVEGYAGCAAAIKGTDFLAPTATLRLPTLAIAGSEDGATPPDLVRETADLVPDSKFHLIKQAGHLPCVEAPDEYARVLTDFLREVGHV